MIDLHHILLPTDFSKFSDVALKYAIALADKFGAEVHLLHVVQDLALFIPEAVLGTPSVAPPVEQFITAANTALERVIKGLNVPGVKLNSVVAEGVPFEEIIRCAREKKIDLIVMGTHGHTGLAHMLMGSVAEKVVRKGAVPGADGSPSGA